MMLIHSRLAIEDCELKFAESEGSFSGYGSVFGNVDAKNDIVMPGAYADVLASGSPVDVYVNHNWLVGELPVGRWGDLKEDDRGLYGAADLVMKMPSAADAYYAMKAGLVSGLSVAIIPDHKAINRRSDGVREIHRVKVLKEISIVTDPANAAAQITNVKFADGTDISDAIDELETVRDFERFLRDAGGLSKGAALALVARAKTIFTGGNSGDAVDAKAMPVLERLIARTTVQ